MHFTDRTARRVSLHSLFDDEFGFDRVPAHKVRTVVDIGANCGVATLRARFLFPAARVIAFEPNGRALDTLRQNTENLDVESHPQALGDGTPKHFYAPSSTLLGRLNNATDKGAPIPTHRLHTLFEEHGVDPDGCVLKIDCEGAEGFIIGNERDEAVLKACLHAHIEFHPKPASWLTGVSRKCLDFERWACGMFLETHYVNIVVGRQAHLTAIRRA